MKIAIGIALLAVWPLASGKEYRMNPLQVFRLQQEL